MTLQRPSNSPLTFNHLGSTYTHTCTNTHTHTHTHHHRCSFFLELNVSALSTDASRNSSCCLWQPQLGFRFMPCQIARIPTLHSLRRCLRKGQLLLSRASLNFVVLVGARWFGCYDTWEKLYDNMTTPK